MAIKEFLDNSLFTDPRSARDLYGNSVRQALDFNVYGRKTMFQAIVLTRPVFLADVAEGDDSLFGYATRDTGKLTKFSFKGRIIEGPSPHEYLPNPCNARGTTAEEKAKIRRLVTLHTTFISSDDYTKSDNYLPQVGDLVWVELKKNVFSYDLQFGTFISVKDNRTNVESDESDALDCESLKNAFRNISGASSTRRSSRGTITGGRYVEPLSGTGRGSAPYAGAGHSAYTPTSTWTAHVSSTSTRDDYNFKSGKCPNALTGYYKTLPVYNTSFLKYSRSDFAKAVAAAGAPYDVAVQAAAFVIISIEQGNYSFPNNNVAGIQTDGGQFRGATLSDVDFQTCYNDGSQFRAFAGFLSIERGLSTFFKIINGKFTSAWSGRSPPVDGTNQEFGDQMADNYYQGWNIITSNDELTSLKTSGEFIRNGIRYPRRAERSYNWNTTANFFATMFERFKTDNPTLF